MLTEKYYKRFFDLKEVAEKKIRVFIWTKTNRKDIIYPKSITQG